MRQSIERRQETERSKATFTVMSYGGVSCLGRTEMFVARESAVSTLSRHVTAPDAVCHASSLPTLLTLCLHGRRKQRRTPVAHPRRTEEFFTDEFFAEGLIARSAAAVLAVAPNRRSLKAVATPITMTEQRRCELA